jgi:tetratricopeptide (TPR) repeat protein
VLRRHRRLPVVALVLVVLTVAGTVAVYSLAQHHLHAAQRALERYDFDEAQHHLDVCLKVRYSSTAVRLLAARTARRRDAYDEAEQHLAACVKLGGMKEGITLERALLTAQQGELTGVHESLQARAGANNAESMLILEALAKGYMNCNWYGHALKCLNALLEREPQHLRALLMRARVWEYRVFKGDTEREEDVLRDYQMAVELKPTFEVRLGLAAALYRVGRSLEALSEYEQLRLVQPHNPEVLLGLARCRYVLHDVDEARRLLGELLTQVVRNQGPDISGLTPDSCLMTPRVMGAALLERGRLALHAGQLADAEEWLRQAASLAPRCDCEALRVLERCLEAANKAEDARKCREEIAQRAAEVLDMERLTLQANKEPRNVPLRYEVAMRQMRLGREEDGVAALFFVLDQAPWHRPAHEAVADYFERTGQPARAARHRHAGLLQSGGSAATQ